MRFKDKQQLERVQESKETDPLFWYLYYREFTSAIMDMLDLLIVDRPEHLSAAWSGSNVAKLTIILEQ